MNTQLHHTLTAASALNQLTIRLAAVPISEATRLLQVTDDTAEFLAALNETQEKIEAALSEVDSPGAMGELRMSLVALRLARQDWYKPEDENRINAANHTAELLERVTAATRSL